LLRVVPNGRMSLEGVAIFIAICGTFEVLFLYWASRSIPGRVELRSVLAFASKMQMQSSMQIFTRGSVVLFLVYILDMLINPADFTSGKDTSYSSAITYVVVIEFATICSVSLTWWRCLSLRKSDANLVELIEGSYTQKRIGVPTPYDAAVNALEKHLERLRNQFTPRYSRMFYQANITITSSDSNGQSSYSLKWALLPIMVRITLSPAGRSSSELVVTYELRGGIHKLEMFPNPAAVYSIMRYLHTNLIQPFTSELALSGAVQKQDELRHQAIESQLRILQAQIEPHFLFNTLANVRHLYRASVEEGEEMLNHLIVYLRSTLEELRSDVLNRPGIPRHY